VLAAFSLRRNVRALLVPPAHTLAPLDGIRGLATLWVIAAHCFFALGVRRLPAFVQAYPAFRFVSLAHYALDAFFVMSGFLIARQLMREHVQTGKIAICRFLVRRAARVLPAYYLALAVAFALGEENRSAAIYNLIYLNNFLPLLKEFLPWTWSLAVEEQFYLTLPLLLLVLHRTKHFRGALLIALALFGAFIRLILVDQHGFGAPIVNTVTQGIPIVDVLYTKTYSRFASLIFGVFAAYLWEYAPQSLARLDRSPRAALLLTLAALGVICLLCARGAPIDIPIFQFGNAWPDWLQPAGLALNRYGVSLAFTCLMVLMLGSSAIGKLLARGFALRIWYPLAQLSYAAYLFHPLVIRMPEGMAVSYGSLALYFLKTCALTYVTAIAVHLCLERPFMNLRAPWPSIR
jgi:peptidoglycan/LPS O-acetylase OafA/YrhL